MNYSWCVLLVASMCMVCEGRYGYVVWNGSKVTVKTSDYFADIPDVYVARATYSNEINTTGYVFMTLMPNYFYQGSLGCTFYPELRTT